MFPSEKKTNRIPALDGLRGVAISLVLLWHYLSCQIIKPTAPGTWHARIEKYLWTTWTGVDLFFILSGFLIFQSFFKEYTNRGFLWAYFVRRSFRILPLYLVLVFCFIVFRAVIPSPERFSWLLDGAFPLWSYFTFTQNWIMGAKNFFGCHWLGVSWSLAVEEQFYLVAPLLFLLMCRFNRWWFFALLWFFPVYLRTLDFGFYRVTGTLFRLDALLLGACVSFFLSTPKTLNQLQQRPWVSWCFLIGSLALVVAKLVYPYFSILGWYDIFAVYALFYACIVLHVSLAPKGLLGRALSNKALVHLGRVSYGVYLFHEVFSGLFHGFLFGGEPKLNSLAQGAATLMALVCSLVFGDILHRCIEAPFIKMGRRISSRLQMAPSTSAKDLPLGGFSSDCKR
ncbi:MAG: acyltransferase [Proteobacteria bacterium]|nr:acyltransferase [Pseudomonadota bacterium]